VPPPGFPPPPGGGYGAYQPGFPPPSVGAGFDGFAIAALVLGLIPCTFFLGIVFGIISLVRIGRTHQRGRGLAIGGIVAGAAWIVAIVLIAVFVDLDEKNATDLKVGDCFDKPTSLEVRTVHSSDCDEPHNAEVFAIIDLPDGDFPGSAEVANEARQQCAPKFADFVGLEPGQSRLQLYYLVPTEDTWKQHQRFITCSVVDVNQKVTGTLKGANR
jgi:hypothetical protein